MKRTALISVYNKTGVVELAQSLVAMGFEIISTGGTANALRDAGIGCDDVSDYTGFSEMMDGRVKTLHPKVHGGILYIRGNPVHEAAARKHGIVPIDLVVVNLYPFEATIAKPGVSVAEAIEQIDIGGPSMLRSAAKNHEFVTVAVDPEDYSAVLLQYSSVVDAGRPLRRQLAAKAFARTAQYDATIATYLSDHPVH